MQFAGGAYEPLEALKVPEKVNLFNFAQADVDGDGRTETVFIGYGDRLYVIDAEGRRLWKSRDYYGATANLIVTPAAGADEATIRGRIDSILGHHTVRYEVSISRS